MKNLAFFALCAVAVHYSMSATVPPNEIYNCEAGATGSQVTSCGMCGSGRIPSSDRLKCYLCPNFCAKGKCTLKSSITNENDATDCSGCIEHYYLKDAKCSECSTGCKNCTDATTCNSCYSNYALKNTPKECASCPSNCLTCTWNEQTTSTECTACKDRFVINEQKGCTSCGSLCKSCTFSKDNGVSCSTCDETAYRDTSAAAATCKSCATSDNGSGCKKCSDATTCTDCLSNAYMLVNNKCSPCSGINAACIECGDNKCKKCQSGFYLKSDSCSICPRNCAECSETDSVVKCTKCKAYYTIVELKSCDRCPDNCRQCKVSGTSVICETCDDKYAKNSNNLCSKCPDNCNACTWSSANSRTECSGSDSSNSCVQKENGKSWGRKSDGTCVACPNNCEKCYFKTSSASTPICYASHCAKGYAFEDATGNCVACPTGCDYCKKRASATTCLKCSAKYAPKYASANVIESCMACSVQNCDYCEVVGSNVQCLRSPCASGMFGSDKKFSFSSKTCSASCPSDSECASGFINDENEACYCRSCPAGKVVIEAGANVGICKGCGTDCESCVLTSDKTDVECKTCASHKQWVSIEVSGSMKKGCYDCTAARPFCKTLELSGSTCRCKADECMGDQSEANRATAVQETGNNQRCKLCSEITPNALWCSGNLGTDNTGNAAVAVCGFQYLKKNSATTCLSIPTACSDWNNNEQASTGNTVCSACAVGHILNSGVCDACPSGCSSCFKDGANPTVCPTCTDATKTGLTCNLVLATDCATPGSVTNCPDAQRYAEAATTCATNCRKCGTGFGIATAGIVANTVNTIGSCGHPVPAPIANCEMHYQDPAAIKCSRCADTHSLKTDGSGCAQVTNCKTKYNFDNTNVANCKVANTNFIVDTVTAIPAVPAAQQAGAQCTGYLSLTAVFAADKARCAGCSAGNLLDSSSSTKYDCVSCSAGSLTECTVATASNGQCVCGRCTADGSGFKYLKHPTETGCVKFAEITSCTAYALKLKNGNYVGACTACSGDTVLAGDALSCISCSSVTCTGSGTKAINSAGTACECTCPGATKHLNQAKNGCVTCSAITNCATIELDSSDACKCTTCNANFQLNSNKDGCVDCTTGGGGATTNCKECSLVAPAQTVVDKCTKCQARYALNPAATPTCIKCSPDPGCDECTVDTSGASPTTQNKCTKCAANWVLNNAGTCIQCPTGCSECRTDPDDQTRALCLTFACSSALKDSDFTCDTCTISNCQYCVKNIANEFKCLKCNKGYYMDSNGACQGCTADCAFCLDGTACLPNGCKEGFIRHRTDGSCISCTGEGVARCIYQTATSDVLIPKICKSGYKLDTSATPNVCEKCDPNCKKCETNGKDKCDSGQCNSGYFYDSTDQKCYQDKSGCATSSRSSGKTVCQSCDTSKSVLANGDCKACGTGCTGCSFDSATSKVACSSCAGGYFKKDSACTACPTGCSACTSSTECTACLATYGLKDKLCVACGVGECQTCEVPSGKSALECKTCSSKFYLNTDDCGECPKNCKECSYNNKYECTKCNDRYARASDGTCVACPSNCETCSANADKTTRCTKCISNGFSLQTDGTCKTCSEAAFANCATCGPTPAGGKAKCDTCAGGFTLQDDKLACLTCSITGCGMCAHGRLCTKCKKGFYLHNYNRECARKCFSCTGNQADCGNDISGLKNATDKVKIIDCGIGDCWAYRTQVGSTVTYARGCSNETCSSSNTNENCRTVDGKKECVKCCKGERCNTWELDGSAGVAGLVAASMLVCLCSILSLIWK